jgi:hypothetical protein
MMKTKILIIFFIFFALISFFEGKVIAWGPITHMTLLDDIIKDPRLGPNKTKWHDNRV